MGNLYIYKFDIMIEFHDIERSRQESDSLLGARSICLQSMGKSTQSHG